MNVLFRRRPPVALLTDFGLRDHYVGTMKAVLARACPGISVVDISHDVQPQRVREAAYLLWASYRYFPDGTIFVAVIDPGVGTDRPVVLTRTSRHLFLAPDNGIMDLIWTDEDRFATYILHPLPLLQEQGIVPRQVSATFHGRDVFAPVAGWLARGNDIESVGRPEPRPRPADVLMDGPESPTPGEVLHVDRFGNIVTNLRAFAGISERLSGLTLNRQRVSHWISTFQEAPAGRPCLLVGSSGLVEVALRGGSAAQKLRAGVGSSVIVRWGSRT